MLHCGLLGKKLGHSYSPQIHRLLGDYAYDLYEKTEEELPDFLQKGEWNGLNVTIPYKKTVLPFCRELSPVAAAIGSVNTLVRRVDGSIYGDNTDAFGFQYLLQKNHFDPAGKKTLILGNGGACASVRYILQEMGAETVVISRKGPETYDGLGRHQDAIFLVNTTPVGMFPENGKAPVDLSLFPHLEGVLDIIYNPSKTALLLQAEALQIPCDAGLSMLVAQAHRSGELFTGAKIPADKIPQIHEILQKEMLNIILIGMPGCGKTTLGQMLAEMTGREFLDGDAAFEKTYGMSAGACILQFGEARFREMETQVLENLGKQSGKIIATGGGCVTIPENYPLLHQNGRIFWIRRDLAALSTEGRPLSAAEGTAALYAKRKPLYERFADEIIENDGSLQECAERIRMFCQ